MRHSESSNFFGESNAESGDEDIVPPEMLDDVERLDRNEYDVKEMISETFLGPRSDRAVP